MQAMAAGSHRHDQGRQTGQNDTSSHGDGTSSPRARQGSSAALARSLGGRRIPFLRVRHSSQPHVAAVPLPSRSDHALLRKGIKSEIRRIGQRLAEMGRPGATSETRRVGEDGPTDCNMPKSVVPRDLSLPADRADRRITGPAHASSASMRGGWEKARCRSRGATRRRGKAARA